MAADIFTKALDGAAFFTFQAYIHNLKTGYAAHAHLQGQSTRNWQRVLQRT
jgi:hypothetical protein